jgi:methylase of polypeptide subunit release factors
VAHLVGSASSGRCRCSSLPATLIPRPDTECLVEQALARCRRRAVFSISAPAPAPSPWRWPANARTAGHGGGCDARCGGAGARNAEHLASLT